MRMETKIEAPNKPTEETARANKHHVVIIGAGMAGLTAAQELLKKDDIHVTILEANDYVGGRVKGDEDFVEGHVIDAGAELLHGKGTMLRDLVDNYRASSEKWKQIPPKEFLKEYFILSHADGGPSLKPTEDNKYGMYFMNNTLMMYNDARLFPLDEALGKLHNLPCDESTSLGQALDDLSPELKSLAVSSYGNTVGSCDLHKISLSLLLSFEDYWQNNEEEGDEVLSSQIGMFGVVKELYRELCQHVNFTMKLNCKVKRIDSPLGSRTEIISTTGDIFHADYAIVTAPPPLWKMIMELPPEKDSAVKSLGMNKAIKCAIKIKEQFWPENLQSIIMADCPIPEIWFHEFENCHMAVCFLTSEAAEDFEKLTLDEVSRITEVFAGQMSRIFSISKDQILKSHLETRL